MNQQVTSYNLEDITCNSNKLFCGRDYHRLIREVPEEAITPLVDFLCVLSAVYILTCEKPIAGVYCVSPDPELSSVVINMGYMR